MCKTVSYIIIIFIFGLSILSAQEQDIALQSKEKKEQTKENEKKASTNPSDKTEGFQQFKTEENTKFIDLDGDGINDNKKTNRPNIRTQGEGKGTGQKLRSRINDRFIDADGDGVNDNRCRGMGLHNGRGKQNRGNMHRGGRK